MTATKGHFLHLSCFNVEVISLNAISGASVIMTVFKTELKHLLLLLVQALEGTCVASYSFIHAVILADKQATT